jgi:hypothetical protein
MFTGMFTFAMALIAIALIHLLVLVVAVSLLFGYDFFEVSHLHDLMLLSQHSALRECAIVRITT